MKAAVMCQEECQQQYPHMKMVSHGTGFMLHLHVVLLSCTACLLLSNLYASGSCIDVLSYILLKLPTVEQHVC